MIHSQLNVALGSWILPWSFFVMLDKLSKTEDSLQGTVWSYSAWPDSGVWNIKSRSPKHSEMQRGTIGICMKRSVPSHTEMKNAALTISKGTPELIDKFSLQGAAVVNNVGGLSHVHGCVCDLLWKISCFEFIHINSCRGLSREYHIAAFQ